MWIVLLEDSTLLNTAANNNAKQYMEALVACHRDHSVAKWWGACNDPKFALSKCLAEEKHALRCVWLRVLCAFRGVVECLCGRRRRRRGGGGRRWRPRTLRVWRCCDVIAPGASLGDKHNAICERGSGSKALL